MKELILTNLSKNKISGKKSIGLGHWINNPKINYLSYHWKNKKKLRKDYKYLNNLSEKLIIIISKRLNFINKENKTLRYWRIILTPWLYVYISSMYDRWEIINSAIKNINNFCCDYFYSEKIFRNIGIADYQKKVTTSDL